MTYCIAVFKSKTDVFAYLELLRLSGVPAVTTGTPKEARIGCGLSVKFSKTYLGIGEAILRKKRFSGFYGIYLSSKVGSRSTLSKIR